jgi:hypothetical protein
MVSETKRRKMEDPSTRCTFALKVRQHAEPSLRLYAISISHTPTLSHLFEKKDQSQCKPAIRSRPWRDYPPPSAAFSRLMTNFVLAQARDPNIGNVALIFFFPLHHQRKLTLINVTMVGVG